MKKILCIAILLLVIWIVPALAESMLEKMTAAAESGDAAAQHKLSMAYCEGEFFPKDLKKAFEWAEKAALQGHVKAQMKLGYFYNNGEGVSKDLKKGFEWTEKAARQGDATAQFGLGGMYIRGEGVARDPEKAIEWMKKAAEQGDLIAQNGLAVLYSEGESAGVAKDAVRAYAYFSLAVKNGDKKEQTTDSMNKLLKVMTKTQIEEAQKIIKDTLDKIEKNKKK